MGAPACAHALPPRRVGQVSADNATPSQERLSSSWPAGRATLLWGPWAWRELPCLLGPHLALRRPSALCPLVSGSQSRAPGAAGGEGLGAQEGAGVGPGGAERSAAAEGRPGERGGGSAQRPGPGMPSAPLSRGHLPPSPLPGPSGRPQTPKLSSGLLGPWPVGSGPPSLSAGHTFPQGAPSLGRPVTSPGCSLVPGGHRLPQRPHHCGPPSTRPHPELRLTHLRDAGLTPSPALIALPRGSSAHEPESPNLASLLGCPLPPRPTLGRVQQDRPGSAGEPAQGGGGGAEALPG